MHAASAKKEYLPKKYNIQFEWHDHKILSKNIW